MRTIRVDQVDLTSDSGLTVAVGTDVDSGERLAFYGDWRMMTHLKEVVEQTDDPEELPLADIEDWQIAGRE